VLALYDQDRRQIQIFGMRRQETPHTVRHISAEGEGLISYFDIDGGSADRVIDEEVAQAKGEGYDLTWLVCPHDRPADLRERLLAHGFEPEEPEAVLVLDLKQVPPALLEAVRHDVRRIEHPDQLDDVISIQQQVWQASFARGRARLARHLVEEPESLSLYVAYVDAVPASTASISYYAGGTFASLVRAATLPAYRRRGLFTALVATLVQDARQHSVRFVDAEAGPMSRPILEKLGFQRLTTAFYFTLHAEAASSAG
jgi:GNAT superfamily N-acetyltransferase